MSGASEALQQRAQGAARHQAALELMETLDVVTHGTEDAKRRRLNQRKLYRLKVRVATTLGFPVGSD